jgi:glycine/D-amino acid oxidase-like deaminating enzyme
MNSGLDARATVLVVGAGIMGAGIAQVAAQAGHPVRLFDAREGAAGAAVRRRRPQRAARAAVRDGGMRFSAFHAGQVIEAGPYAVSEVEVLQFTRAYDPQWFHADPEAPAAGRFGGLIASGWHTCAIAMRLAPAPGGAVPPGRLRRPVPAGNASASCVVGGVQRHGQLT